MSALWQTKIDRVSPELASSFRATRERWAKKRISCAPADRSAAELGILRAYRSASLTAPRRIVWVEGPWHLRRELPSQTERSVQAQLLNDPLRWANGRIGTKLSNRLMTELSIMARQSPTPFDARGTVQALETALVEPRTSVQHIRRMFSRVWSGPQQFPGSWLWTQHDTDWLWQYDFIREAFDMESELEPVAGLLAIASSAGFIMPFESVCFVGERHSILKCDPMGRLHCADGPAIEYPDQWRAFYWKGVPVASWLIERSDLVTTAAINFETDPITRRCMIGIRTPERYIESGTVTRVASDDTGVLWRRQWSNDTWSCVEVVNGTAEPDGTFKKYFIEVPAHISSAREGVAWTYGLTCEEYKKLVLRT